MRVNKRWGMHQIRVNSRWIIYFTVDRINHFIDTINHRWFMQWIRVIGRWIVHPLNTSQSISLMISSIRSIRSRSFDCRNALPAISGERWGGEWSFDVRYLRAILGVFKGHLRVIWGVCDCLVGMGRGGEDGNDAASGGSRADLVIGGIAWWCSAVMVQWWSQGWYSDGAVMVRW